ncbi:MAG: carboxylesterase family protein [Chitinophagales bacterium]|nr:carboxylesterase family protein [Chitinophagales bacterium]
MKQYLFFIVFFFVFQLSYAQCNGRYVNNLFAVDTMQNIQFGENIKYDNTNQKLFFDLYKPKSDTAKNRPCLVFCFGGSFVSGDKRSPELVYLANEFAKKGYVCISIDYRLDNSFNLLVEESMTKAVVRAIQDGRASLRYLNKYSDSLGIDTNQIFIGGTSAGGILALNLTFMDQGDKLPANWLNWANSIGGLEGNSGNVGYSSKVKGAFAFAGALGDTAFLNEMDYPVYMCHSTNDATVLNGYGKPIGGLAPVSLFGSKTIKEATDRMGIYSVYDEYNSVAHPPFVGVTASLSLTLDHMTTFLFNVLTCNPAKTYEPKPKAKNQSFSSLENRKNAINIYPNPSTDFIEIRTSMPLETTHILDIYGRKMPLEWISGGEHRALSLLNYPKGLYSLILKLGERNIITKFVKD